MIKFPRMHIAQSVVNRIINVANQVPRSTEMTPLGLMPNAPEPGKLGEQIDQAVSTPPGQMEMPAGGEDAIVSSSLGGTSPADALAQQGVLND